MLFAVRIISASSSSAADDDENEKFVLEFIYLTEKKIWKVYFDIKLLFSLLGIYLTTVFIC